MKITILKKQGKSEVINREELSDLVDAIKNGLMRVSVKHTRELYHLLNPHRQPDGQVTTQWEGGIKLPRICFAADYMKRNGEWKMMDYNALVVLEVNDLVTYEKAVEFGFDIPFMEHMASFDYGYKIAAVRDWLFKQSK